MGYIRKGAYAPFRKFLDSVLPKRGEKLLVQNTTDCSGVDTGSIQTLGGAYIAKSLLVGNKITANELQVDNVNINGSAITGTSDANTTITAYAGKAVAIEGVSFDGTNVSGMGTLSCGAITSSGKETIQINTASTINNCLRLSNFVNGGTNLGTSIIFGSGGSAENNQHLAKIESSHTTSGYTNLKFYTNKDASYESSELVLTLGHDKLATFAGKLETTSTAVDSIKTAGGGSFGNAVSIGSANPWFYFNETDQSADNKIWLFNATGGNLFIGVKKDDTTGGTNALSLYRTGENITGVNFGNITSNPVFNFLGTGLVKASGKIETTSTASDSIKTAGGVESAGTVKVGAYTLPATDGTDGQVLVTNGAGVLTWTTL